MDSLVKISLMLVVIIIMVLIVFFGSVPMKKGKTEINLKRWDNLGNLGGVICVLVIMYKVGFIPSLFFAVGLGLVYRSILEIIKLNFEKK